MPNRYRRVLGLLLLSAVFAPGGCTCASERVEQQRKLLKPKDRAKARAELVDKHRLKTPEGNLRPSDEEVAGLILPRGLALHRKFEHEWYYRTTRHDVTLPRLEEFFRAQLVTVHLAQTKTGAIRFINAQIKSDLKAPLVTVRISPLLNGSHRNEVYIKQAPPARIEDFPTADEAQVQLEARRKYAD